MRRLSAFILGAFVIATVADAWFLRAAAHGEFWWLGVYGFFSLFGFVGCLTIVLVTKLILGSWLQRKEGYYDLKKSP